MLYHWLIAFHIIAIVCWFAGLFYLPRIFVYHASANSLDVKAVFKTMERKLYLYIMHPSLIVTVITGYWLVLTVYTGDAYPMWLHIKLILVGLLVIYHFVCGYYVRAFRLEKNTKSHVYFRFFNEFPTLILIAVVCLAVLQP